MTQQRSCGVPGWTVGMMLMILAGCDSAPNPAFEQELKEQQAATSGDPYATLSSAPPRLARHFRVEPALRAAQAGSFAQTLQSNYALMLGKLDAEAKPASLEALISACRASFADAVAYQASAGVSAEAAKATGTALFDRLTQCRDQAIAVDSRDEGVVNQALLLRRFASTGMVLTAISTVAKGDEATGLALWRQGDERALEDKPGFKLTPNAFRPGW